jgi:hypothetical protein
MLFGGVIAAVDILLQGRIGVAWSALFLVGGLIVFARALRAPRPLRSGGLKRDLAVLGVALASGALFETLHILGLLAGSLYHVALASGLGIGAALLLTSENRRFAIEARVVGSLRLAAALLFVAAAVRLAAVGAGAAHGRLGALSMIALAAAGLVLVRAGTRTPSVAWQRL